MTHAFSAPWLRSCVAATWLVCGPLSCAGDEPEPDKTDGDADTDTDADSDTDTDTDTVVAPYGLDARPANPTCVAPPPPLPAGDVVLTRVFQNLSHNTPMMMLQAPGDSGYWYLIEKAGRVYRFENDPAVNTRTQVLDVSGEVNDAGNEMGLLGMAFHPDYQTNGQLFLYYSAFGGQGGSDHESHVSRFTTTDGGLTFGSEQVVMVIDEPFSNHNGGTIAFGPDGFLYIGLGDGGSGGDPFGNGQNTFSPLGKMLRIDVDGGTPYAIPSDNPYASGASGLPEIYAIGLRNPFRWSFDPPSGDLWVGDVGQNLWEEVDRVELGGNYGWNVREGEVCYNATNCANTFQMPEVVYEHSQGGEAVIGGMVYRGSAIPSLAGVYLFNDWVQNDIIGLFYDPVTGLPAPKVVVDTQIDIVHYTADSEGEIYLLDYTGDDIYLLEPGPGAVDDPFPDLLSETGCFQPGNVGEPVDAFLPYDITHPFWSDGAGKARWLAIPDGTTITVQDDGDWDFPLGSVLGKQFEKDGVLIETRLLMRHDDGSWGGYSYLWNDARTDATLVRGTRSVTLPSEEWSIPGDQCGRCHTEVAGSSLGLETAQLNKSITYPTTGRNSNQLATLDHIGFFAAPIGDPAALPAFPAIDDPSATVEARARAYLHVNCSQCHRPDGPTRVQMDFRVDTALADMGICGDPEQGDLGVAGAKVVAPGDPSHSVLSLRMRTRDVNQMPPLGTAIVDEVAADVVDEWITSLTSCP